MEKRVGKILDAGGGLMQLERMRQFMQFCNHLEMCLVFGFAYLNRFYVPQLRNPESHRVANVIRTRIQDAAKICESILMELCNKENKIEILDKIYNVASQTQFPKQNAKKASVLQALELSKSHRGVPYNCPDEILALIVEFSFPARRMHLSPTIPANMDQLDLLYRLES
jgi:hypothetical protein